MATVAAMVAAMVAALLAGCPSFPDPVKAGADSGKLDIRSLIIDSSQPALPNPDMLVDPDASPLQPDAPTLTDLTTLHELGQACKEDWHCKSNHCADYTCCDSKCAGTCEACNLPGKLGTCTKIPDGFDPRNDCTASTKYSCGDDGQCDGSGACRKWPNGTRCSQASCDNKKYELTNIKECDGNGTCVSLSNIKCDPYSCSTLTKQCFTTCTDVDEGYTCQGWYGCDSKKGVCYTSCSKDHHCVNGGACDKGKCVDD